MKNLGNIKILSFSFFIFCSSLVLIFSYPANAQNGGPRLVNYHLGEIHAGLSRDLSRYDILVLSPAQIATKQETIRDIERFNPDIIILAYVPSQSYNIQYWPRDAVFNGVSVSDSWWLRDAGGSVISAWPGIKNINLHPDWSDYFLVFVRDRISSIPGVDGIFFDMVSHNISWLNNGDIDLDNNGMRDKANDADALWLQRTEYFFMRAKEIMPAMYLVNNGTSIKTIQPYVHGRMYENFPTPWVGDGSWGDVMNTVVETKKNNRNSRITIINSNTGNTGVQNYRDMRFGLGSALLEDGYFSYDFGDKDHGQTWWYDEYNARLGNAIGASESSRKYSDYAPDVWRRDFDHGLVLVNSKAETSAVQLGADYEKINGVQDRSVNDGSIVSEIDLGGNDGIVLLKTVSRLDDIIFGNGSFARFYKSGGERTRNGFFLFDEAYKGGTQIIRTDLDGDGVRDSLVASGNKITATRADGLPFFKIYPYTAGFLGTFRLAIGDIDKNGNDELYVAPASGKYPIKIYNLVGEEITAPWYPFGPQYTGGYSLALLNDHSNPRLIIGSLVRNKPGVGLYDADFKKTGEWIVFDKRSNRALTVGAGDLNGDGISEIIAGFGDEEKPVIKMYNADGARFGKSIVFEAQNFRSAQIQTSDIDFDGASDIVLLTTGAL